ncbi:MAG TPA: 4Fe-4S binding protein [Spirochaetota bacterium]|mgnify:CR=1 FL=1|nr:4Fe-4S binding protein [Spirochaetota bacterium]HOS38261.1 4Fe-4S binding protein [Spirochaetota bacterium]HPI22037.1 4Fe-4S binding protein [Spirochaetota bacterium]
MTAHGAHDPGGAAEASRAPHEAHVRLARAFSSVFLIGPPMGEELVHIVSHLFTHEEAAVAARVPYYLPRSARTIARRVGRPVAEVAPLLDAMAARRVIVGTRRGYALIPLIPGMFEYMLMPGEASDWHRTYGDLISRLFESGFTREYSTAAMPAIRTISVQKTVEGKSHVVDADLVSRMIDAHEDLAVAKVCQCRQSARFSGRECARSAPEDGCLIFGAFAASAAGNGSARRVSRDEMRAIVDDRWKKRLIFFAGNVDPASPNAICTCCDCCCHYVEAITRYGAMATLSPPHYIALVDEARCTDCGLCVPACNTRAHTLVAKKHGYDASRCVGCGLCVDACRRGAVTMAVNPSYRRPSRSFPRLMLRLAPAIFVSGLRVLIRRRRTAPNEA